MKLLIWSVFGLLALMWTLGAWVLHALAGWLARVGVGAAPADALPALADWHLPAWLLQWVDVSSLQALHSAALAALEALRQAGPWVGEALGWLQPLVWGAWALGLLLLLAAAGGLHLVLKTALPAPAPAVPAAAAATPPGAA